MEFDKPSDHIAEITIIGTGGGYGESCLIHLGNQKWVVVDSCIDPKTKESLPLKYLKDIGVNTNTDVVLIICTHWDDDHILGISQLLENCAASKFSFAKANDKVKFLKLVSLDYLKIANEASSSSTYEFNKCIDILEIRNSNPKVSSADKILVTINIGDFQNQVISLSPSDSAIREFDNEISQLITDYGQSNRRIVQLSPNFKSVSLFVKIGHHRAILGADLEVSKTDKTLGWDDIVDNSQSIDKKAAFFKIPHHGSENAFHEGVWLYMLSENTKSGLTPWNRGSKLPTQIMQELYKSKSNELFITSNFNKASPKKRDKSISRMIAEFNIELEEVPFKHGIIRARIDMNNNAEWLVENFGTATKL
jgi:beta-lactamase superfamily II metal-dependent hydrolase